MISASAARAAASAGSRNTRIKLWSLPSRRSMRASRLSVSSTGDSSRLPISAPVSAIVRKSGTIPSLPGGREDMGRLGAHGALSPDPLCHFLDEMSGGGDFRPFALRYVEPGAGERRLDLGAGHA